MDSLTPTPDQSLQKCFFSTFTLVRTGFMFAAGGGDGTRLEANEDKQTDAAAPRGKTTVASPALLITSSSALRI